ncbi:MAG: hypothetical protein ACJAV6_000514 [Candidatus Paceibacteria bacterium]|jgi:hypothetical protein
MKKMTVIKILLAILVIGSITLYAYNAGAWDDPLPPPSTYIPNTGDPRG